jgi:hypothetical protein
MVVVDGCGATSEFHKLPSESKSESDESSLSIVGGM